MSLFRRLVPAVLTGLCLVSPAAGHDFWLVPQSFEVEPGEAPSEVKVAFMVGHADEVNPWNLQWDRVVAVRAHGPGGAKDLSPTLSTASRLRPGTVTVAADEPGTHVVAFESNHSFSELEADKFNDYAKSEGLRAIIEAREAAGTTDESGREIYGRRAKVLLQVGSEATDHAMTALGHTLEIVPEANPYALSEDRRLPVRVMFRGTPLEGAAIDITALGTGEEAFATEVTDADGRAVFEVPEGGAYRISTVWGVPNVNTQRAEFETMFSSLTFGG